MKWFNSETKLPDDEQKVLLSVNGVYKVCKFTANKHKFVSGGDEYEPGESIYWTSYTSEHESDEDPSEKRKKKRNLYVNNFLQQIVDTSADVIIVLDKEFNFLLVNKRYEKLLNLKREDILGKNLFEVNPGAKDTMQHDYLNKALAGESLRLDNQPGIAEPETRVNTQFTPLSIDGNIEGVMVRSKILNES
jgi:PAS domain-containing protein